MNLPRLHSFCSSWQSFPQVMCCVLPSTSLSSLVLSGPRNRRQSPVRLLRVSLVNASPRQEGVSMHESRHCSREIWRWRRNSLPWAWELNPGSTFRKHVSSPIKWRIFIKFRWSAYVKKQSLLKSTEKFCTLIYTYIF